MTAIFRSKIIKATISLVALCQFLLLQSMALNPSLHKEIHHHQAYLRLHHGEETHGHQNSPGKDSGSAPCVVEAIFHGGFSPVLTGAAFSVAEISQHGLLEISQWDELILPARPALGIYLRGPPICGDFRSV